MLKKTKLLALFFFLFVLKSSVLWATPAAEYLCEIGITYFRTERYDDALHEFEKALMIEPDNLAAKTYIGFIFQKEVSNLPSRITTPAKPPTKPSVEKVVSKEKLKTSREEIISSALMTKLPMESTPTKAEVKEKPKPSREEIISNTFTELSQKKISEQLNLQKPSPAAKKTSSIKITGETQLRLGMTAQDTYWKRANWDLNEKNWRMLSDAALDRREDTYDPRTYDRLRLNLDTDNKEGFGFHSNLMVDPWSFTGKSDKVTVTSIWGDAAEVELKYWSNTGYTINQLVPTLLTGNDFALPEIKVVDGKTHAVTIAGNFADRGLHDQFTIPALKINREFQPVRELWFDYNRDDLKLRVYPIAYENQALTFDDPLKLSNNHIWWEDSPWIHGWKPGIYNSGVATPDFTKGYWDNTLSFFARDSEGRRLTSLRGFSFEFNPLETTSVATSVAMPKNPWQDYSDMDNFLSATRIKQSLTEDLNVGLTATTRLGYDVDNENKLDARNYVLGTDLGYEIIDGLKTSFEVARSQSEYDLTNSQYKTENRGNAYHFSIIGRFPLERISNVENGYDGIQPQKQDTFFTKFRFFVTRLDDSFDEPLSSYVETRDDEFWSRHLHFRTPFKYYYQGEGKLLTWDDIKNYRIGNGVDIGRSVLGLRIESSFWDKKVDNLFDVRNVHDTEGKFVENVAREELTWSVNNKLTTKLLGINHHLPKTTGGIDPFVFNPRNRVFYNNSYIEDGKDPSVNTGSLGLEYAFFDWLALNGIWEYTNDISLGYDNFPRGILNDGNRSLLSYQDGNIYRDVRNWLYDQQLFPRPPYSYYNIFKTGLRFTPIQNLELYLDYTRNPYEKAGQVDDNMNHIGFEVSYTPTSKIALFFKYTYSRWQDLDALTQGISKVFGHHNLFTEFIYRISENEDFTFQYGEASRDPFMGGVLDIGWDPYGGSLRTIDIQHIFRMYYRRKF
jgi:tetratricopeptide (TPR) repeat protein